MEKMIEKIKNAKESFQKQSINEMTENFKKLFKKSFYCHLWRKD